MIASVVCAICKRKVQFNLLSNRGPDLTGWEEWPIESVISWKLPGAENRCDLVPVCPECARRRTQIYQQFHKDYDPFGEKGGHKE